MRYTIAAFAAFASIAAAVPQYGYGEAPVNTPTPTPEYPSYPVSSKAPEYPAYPEYPAETYTSVVTGLTTVCPEPTTVTYGTKTYTVSTSTTLIDDDCEYTTTYEVKPTVKPSVKPSTTPAYTPPVVPYPSKNATTPYPTGVKPSSTKPAPTEFTGAAAQAGVGLVAIVGAVAAFL